MACYYQFFSTVEDVIRNDLKMLAHPVPPSKLHNDTEQYK